MPDTVAPYGWRAPLGGDFLKNGFQAIRDLATDITATVLGIDSRAPFTCTSTTRPANPADGRMIYETDTKAHGFYDAAASTAAGAPVWRIFDSVPQLYTPTLANGFTVGNGTNAGYYTRRGRRVSIRIQMIVGSTGANGGSGAWVWGLPSGMTVYLPNASGGSGSVNENPLFVKGYNSMGNVVGFAPINTGGQTLSVFLPSSATNVTLSAISGTAPGTWLAGQNLNISGEFDLSV